MRFSLMALTVSLSLMLLPTNSAALSMNDFARICESYNGDCSNQPFLQAYVGGALDLVAMLDEETDYLDEIYCRTASEFFDVPEIIRYMMAHKDSYGDRNAMLVVIRYLEEMGGCDSR